MTGELSELPSPPSRNARCISFSLNLALIPLALYFTFLLVYPAERVSEAIRFPYQLDAEEGFMLGQSLRLVSGEGMYLSITKPPYVVDNYPPLYPALWSLASRWTGPSLAPGRWIVALSAIAIALAIAIMIAGTTRSPAMAWLAPLFFLTSFELLRWSGYARVDLPAIALSVWGLAVFGLWGLRSRLAWYVALTLFALSLLTKQTAIAAPLACFLSLLTRRDWLRALRFAIGLALAAGIPTLLLCLWTRGQYWLHTVTYNKNVMHWRELTGWARHLYRFYWPLLIALALLALWAATRKKSPDEPDQPAAGISLYLIYAALACLSLFSLAKAGAAENYLLEPWAAAALFLGVAQGTLMQRINSPNRKRTETVVAVLAATLLYAHAARFCVNQFEAFFLRTAPRPTVADLLRGNQIIRAIENRPGPVLCEEPIYTFLARRPVLFQHFIMTELAAEGKWDPTPIVKMVERGEFSLVESHQDLFNENQFFNRYPPAFRKALRARYVELEQLDQGRLQPVFLYVPPKGITK